MTKERSTLLTFSLYSGDLVSSVVALYLWEETIHLAGKLASCIAKNWRKHHVQRIQIAAVIELRFIEY